MGGPASASRSRGDDGNLYYYFHLDSYAGGSRQVSQGEVIGYTGNTGDASGGPTHTHFEVHPGGRRCGEPVPVRRRRLLATRARSAARRALGAATAGAHRVHGAEEDEHAHGDEHDRSARRQRPLPRRGQPGDH